MTDFSTVPAGYRRCVGIFLLNGEGRVWIGRRIEEGDETTARFRWQLPQGGIDPGEAPERAAFRELEEESGTAQAVIIAQHPELLTYDFPEEVMARKKAKGQESWRGQCQAWFAMRFQADDSAFALDRHTPEFDAWRWAEPRELPGLVIPFKRPVYESVVAAFAPLAAR